jgi:hypothetical protein
MHRLSGRTPDSKPSWTPGLALVSRNPIRQELWDDISGFKTTTRITDITKSDKPVDTPNYAGVENLKTAFPDSDIVAMISKNSGRRFGRYSHISHHVIFDRSEQETEEHVIMSPMKSDVFSVKGDSGSCIMNSRGNVIGMLIGGSDSGGTYFTPIYPLLQSVEKTTGKKLRWLSAETSEELHILHVRGIE